MEDKVIGVDKPVLEQLKILEIILLKNKKLKKLLERLSNTNLKNYYVAAGCINQTVFNYYHGYPLMNGIKDFDIVYFDNDISYEKEDSIIKEINNLVYDLNIICDVKNEARVHLWYNEKYGKQIEPYTSVGDAIDSWGTSITCLGVRLENNKLVVYTPYGLNDLFSMTIRPIKEQFTKEQYEIKTSKWKKNWPKLNILPWNE